MVEVYVNYASQTLLLSYYNFTLCTGITQDSRGAQSLQALVSLITQSAEKAVLFSVPHPPVTAVPKLLIETLCSNLLELGCKVWSKTDICN